MSFEILTGKALASKIKGYGKVAATFSAATHQLAYCAILHNAEHHDAIYMNAIYAATPVNYRKPLVDWFKAFAGAKFDAQALTFTYDKSAKSDLATALTISPADYAKAEKPKQAAKPLEERVSKLLTATVKDDEASREDKAFARAMLNALNAYKASLVKADNVTTLRPNKAARKAAAKQAATAATPEAAAA